MSEELKCSQVKNAIQEQKQWPFQKFQLLPLKRRGLEVRRLKIIFEMTLHEQVLILES